MGITYADETCVDVKWLSEQFKEKDPPLPVPWYGKPNHFVTNLGTDSGKGILLLTKFSFDRLVSQNKINSQNNDLVFSDGKQRTTLKKIIIRKTEVINPSYSTDPKMIYLCEMADVREALAQIPINKAYNVRSSPGGTMISGTQNSGSNWTWSEMVQDVWQTTNSGLGTWPGLPFTPHGTPEGFIFYGSTVFAALKHVLTRLACALRFNPLTGAFTIVRLGSTDSTATSVLNSLQNSKLKIWDQYPNESAYLFVREKVRTLFVKQPAPTDGTSIYYVVDNADSSPLGGTLTGGVVNVYDDLPALMSGGSPTNTTDLNDRASERASDWFRVQKSFLLRQEKVFKGQWQQAASILGSTYGFLGFEDRGMGHKTTLFTGDPVDGMRIEDWRPDPITFAVDQGLDFAGPAHVTTSNYYIGQCGPSKGSFQSGAPPAVTGGTMYWFPLITSQDRTIDQLLISVNNAGVAEFEAQNVRLGIYEAVSKSNLTPSVFVTDGNVDVSTTGIKTLSVSVALDRKKFYFVSLRYGNPITAGRYPTLIAVNLNNSLGFNAWGANTVGLITPTAYQVGWATYALGNLASGPTTVPGLTALYYHSVNYPAQDAVWHRYSA